MYNVAVIGAGQLGSRHLQALKSSSLAMHIFVVDNSQGSLESAKMRYDILPENDKQHVSYCSSIQSVPQQLDLVIVATSSKPRASVVKSLLEHAEVKYMVLEKVLFPRISEYEEILSLLHDKKVSCWVNCPRRMYGLYQEIKEKIDVSQPVSMLYQGSDWGLCCNSIHMIDLLMFLTNDSAYTIDVTGLHDEIVSSKRKGYIEFLGTIVIKTSHGSTLKMTCEKERIETRRAILNADRQFEISEEEGWWKENGLLRQYKIPYQSQLTGLLADTLLSIGYCPLTSFENSVRYHKPFVSAILTKYNELQGTDSDLCPIT